MATQVQRSFILRGRFYGAGGKRAGCNKRQVTHSVGVAFRAVVHPSVPPTALCPLVNCQRRDVAHWGFVPVSANKPVPEGKRCLQDVR